MSLRERKKQQTRRLIAETARRLFSERGFEQVTVAEIARAAEVSSQTVFNYFPTKEDLVFWRLESFEDELLTAIREREVGESALAAFGRFVRAPRGMLGQHDPEAREALAALTRMIVSSPALLAREQRIFARLTETLAEELGGDIQARVAATAMLGVHRALLDFTRERIVAGARHPGLADEVRARADAALTLLERGLGEYGVRD